LVCSHALANAPVLVVRDTTILTKPQSRLRLIDIAELQNVSDETRRELEDIVISNAPRDNEKRVFTRYALSEMLRGTLHNHPMLTVIPEKVQVMARMNPLHPERLAGMIIDHYRSKVDGNILVENLKVPDVAGQKVETVHIQFKDELPKGSFSFPLQVSGAGITKSFWLTGKMRHETQVAVLRRSINSGDSIQVEDYTMEKRDVTFAPDAPANPSDLALAKAARALGVGSILWRSTLQRQPAMRAGETVKLILANDGWQVSASAVVQQQGFVGDTVKVANPITQKIMSGTVIEKGVVRVQ